MSLFGMFGRQTALEEGLEKFRSAPGAVLLDVRSEEEYASGHVPGSVNLPLDRIDEISLGKDKPLFIYCYSGVRAGQAAAYLQRQGYDAVNIGGISGYRGETVKGK